MTNSLLFVAADPRECAGFISHWEQVRPLELPVHWARAGRWKGHDVTAVANGAGAERAFAAVLVAPRPSVVCNIGFCGALDEALRIGDIVVATEVRNGTHSLPALLPDGLDAATGDDSAQPATRAGVVRVGGENTQPATRAGVVRVGVAASINHIAQTAVEKRNLRASGASIVEMEAAGAARASEDLGLPFYCIRAVSDLAHEDLINDFNAALGPDGRFSIVSLMKQLKWGELVRLQQRTALASKKLGDFIDATSF